MFSKYKELNDDAKEYFLNLLTIKVKDDKPLIQENKVDIKNAFHTEFEEEIAILLNPKIIDDYVKVISLALGTRLWMENQDELFNDGKKYI